MSERFKNAFDQVRASENMKQSTCAWLMEQRNKKRTVHMTRPILAGAVLCFALYWVFFLPVAYISVDVNPSIELSVNRMNYVIHAEAYNEDGERILCALDLNNRTYEDAVEKLLDSAEMRPYLLKDSALTITVACDDAGRVERLEEVLGTCTGVRNHHGRMYSTSVASRQQAHECGMSFGKYNMYEHLCENGADLTTEECRGMNMGQLNRLLSECEGRGNASHGHHGAGHE